MKTTDTVITPVVNAVAMREAMNKAAQAAQIVASETAHAARIASASGTPVTYVQQNTLDEIAKAARRMAAEVKEAAKETAQIEKEIVAMTEANIADLARA